MREFLVHSVFFGAAVSLVGYEVGLLLKRKFKMAIFNPLLIAILCVMAILTVGDISYDDYNQGAQYLSYLLQDSPDSADFPVVALSGEQHHGKHISQTFLRHIHQKISFALSALQHSGMFHCAKRLPDRISSQIQTCRQLPLRWDLASAGKFSFLYLLFQIFDHSLICFLIHSLKNL